MIVELRMPKYGSMMTEGFVGDWLAEEGDAVKKGDPLLEVETDKLTNKVLAPADGVLRKIVAKKGDTVAVGGMLAVVET